MFSQATMDKGDAIAIYWHIDDVKAVDNSLTDEQARIVLERLKNKHDATIGINWDTIDVVIDICKDLGEI